MLVRPLLLVTAALASSCTFDPGGLLVLDDDGVADGGSLPIELDGAPADADPAAPRPDADPAAPHADAAPPAACPLGYDDGVQTGSAYRVVSLAASWPVAEGDCASDGAGTHLVVIDGPDELFVVGALAGQSQVWIGVHDRNREDRFELVTGGEAAFLPWIAGEPNDSGLGEDCVELVDGELNDEHCDLALNAYVCECDGAAPF